MGQSRASNIGTNTCWGYFDASATKIAHAKIRIVFKIQTRGRFRICFRRVNTACFPKLFGMYGLLRSKPKFFICKLRKWAPERSAHPPEAE